MFYKSPCFPYYLLNIEPILNPSKSEKSYEAERYFPARLHLAMLFTQTLLPKEEIHSDLDWDKIATYDFSKESTEEGFQKEWQDFLEGRTKDETGIMNLRLAWYRFLERALVNEAIYNELLSSNMLPIAGKSAHQSQFLIQEERDTIAPKWRERFGELNASENEQFLKPIL